MLIIGITLTFISVISIPILFIRYGNSVDKIDGNTNIDREYDRFIWSSILACICGICGSIIVLAYIFK